LQYLELWMVRGLTDLDAVASLGNLQYLFLQALKNVTALASFRRSHGCAACISKP
jgi:hypothetical protein